jgi:acetyl esterase
MRERGLDEELAAILRLGDLASRKVHASPLRLARAELLAQIAIAEDVPAAPVSVDETTIEGPAGPLRLRLYSPRPLRGTSAALLFLHGGGWVLGDLDSHDTLCRRLATGGGLRVVAVDYRRAPEAPFPAAVHDAGAAYRWLVDSAASLEVDPRRIGLIGDSAGGNLAAVLALRTRGERVPPALQVLIYPAVDGTCSQPSQRDLGEGLFLDRASIDWYYAHYAAGADRRDPDLSPLFAPEVRNAPRALVFVADLDPLRDEGLAYAERLRQGGCDVMVRSFRGLAHGFALMTGLCRAAYQATDEIARATGQALAKPHPDDPPSHA